MATFNGGIVAFKNKGQNGEKYQYEVTIRASLTFNEYSTDSLKCLYLFAQIANDTIKLATFLPTRKNFVNITSIIERDTELYIDKDVVLTLVYTTQETPSKGIAGDAIIYQGEDISSVTPTLKDNEDNKEIEISSLTPPSEEVAKTALLRASEKEPWKEVGLWLGAVSHDTIFTFKDYALNSGSSYLYKVNYYNAANMQIGEEQLDICTSMAYEHAILIGQDASYSLKFNPEVTNLKYNYADAVTATLGSAYPFVRRNGKQKYRTFTLGGMISYHMTDSEEEGVFVPHGEYEDEQLRERLFRDALFNFLHDGKVKLFKSTQEGNMLVRLTNISLTSNKTLDRNIYSFSATATEICEATVENIKKYVPQCFEIVTDTIDTLEVNEQFAIGYYDEETQTLLVNNIYVEDEALKIYEINYSEGSDS